MRKIKEIAFIYIAVYIFTACQGTSSSKGQGLSYDKSLSNEQQIELLKSQAKSFADSIRSIGYDVLGTFIDEKNHSVFYIKKGLTINYEEGHMRLLPIKCKDIKTGEVNDLKIPATMDGHTVKVNLLLGSCAADNKMLLLSTNKNSAEINDDYSRPFSQEPIDVFLIDVNDLSFHYVIGGRHWMIGKEGYGDDAIPFLTCYDERNLKIPLIQIFDGTYSKKNVVENSKSFSLTPDAGAYSMDVLEESCANGYESVLSERKLSYSDLSNKTTKELEIMRNSIYARYGYRFKRDDLFSHFSQYSWYKPTTSDVSAVYNSMSAIEKYNVDFIKKHE